MRFRLIMFATLSVVAARVCAQSPVPAIAAINKQPVPFRSGTLNLVGFLFKPEGAGPFPAVLWNHGSERGPGQDPQLAIRGQDHAKDDQILEGGGVLARSVGIER